MNPVVLEHGERFGQLCVLRKEGAKYRVGCSCGNSKELYRAKALRWREGVRACRKCRKQMAGTFNHAINDFQVPQRAEECEANRTTELVPAEVGIHDPAPECEGVNAA